MGKGVRLGSMAALLLLAACSDPPVELFVDLRTDYVGGVEARLARVRVYRGDDETPVRTAETALIDENLTDGERIAEISALEPATYRVVVSLEGNLRVPERSIRVSLETTRAVTVVITRDCMEVACPAPESPALTECLGGRCVDPTCTPEDPASCPAPECTADSECTTSVGCAVATCVGGVCSARGDSAGCAGSEYCDPSFGCRVRPGLPPSDGGMDGGLDAGDGAIDAADSSADADAMDASAFGVLALSAGYAHSCVVKLGGELWCWGDNRDGQLGDPALGMGTAIPRRIGTAGDWTDVVCAGHYDVPLSKPAGYTCGIRGGELYCWGKNEAGELGLGTMTPVDTPTRVGAFGDWTTLAADWAHTLGLRGAGELYAWGEGGNGANGNGSGANQLTPIRVGTATWREIAAGDDHGCGIQSDGSLWCWGNGTNGETALGMETIEYAPVRVGAATDWYGLTANCALRGGGDVYCWGNNLEGRVGDGTTMPALTPVNVASPGFDSVQTSLLSTLATKAGTLAGWGLNDTAQLGDATLGARRLTPALVDSGPGWRLVSISENHGCGVRDDIVYCWGNTQDGRTGTGFEGIVMTPTPVAF